jgi:hypothetical protein
MPFFEQSTTCFATRTGGIWKMSARAELTILD